MSVARKTLIFQCFQKYRYLTSAFDRPDFERLMEDVKAGKIDCIVVKDLSRFGRNYRETGNYLERIFPFLGVRFIAINDHFDTLTAENAGGGYIIPLKNIINEVYSKDISRKVSSAQGVKRRNGEFLGTWAAYGYKKCADDSHQIEPNEETSPVVRDIFMWRLGGLSHRAIAKKLNELGIPSPGAYHYLNGEMKSDRHKDAQWRRATIKTILSREIYLGHMVQGCCRKSLCTGEKRHQLPKSEWTVVKNTHEAIIDEATFLAVQSIRDEQQAHSEEQNGKYDSLGKSENILKGLVVCANCKRNMIRYRAVTGKNAKVTYNFRCPTHDEDSASCSRKYILETELLTILWDAVQQQLELANDFTVMVQRWKNSTRFISQENQLQQKVFAAKQALNRSETLYDSLYQSYADKLMTEQEYINMKRRYREDIDCAQSCLQALEQQTQVLSQQTEHNDWLTACARFRDEIELTDELAHTLIERVEISNRNVVSITFRYQNEYRMLVQLAASAKAVESA